MMCWLWFIGGILLGAGGLFLAAYLIPPLRW
jgi:hypothetical protein